MNSNVRINERIIAHRIRLIDQNGVNRGEMLKAAALTLAREVGLDLVEVSPGQVPVCKILDQGKVLFERSKAERHHNHAPTMKEMRFNYNIGEHDLDIKKRKITEFLEGGHKVSVSMQLKGREKYAFRAPAKQKFVSVVTSLAPKLSLTEIKESGNGFSVLLDPSRVK